MITAIGGMPGAGKTSLLMAFIEGAYWAEGQEILDYSIKRIEEFNSTRLYPLEIPDKVPLFANFEARFKVDYEKWYKPYMINVYRFGLPGGRGGKFRVQYLPPGSKLFLTEVQRYFDNRQSQSLPPWVSRAFEMHRHFGLDIYLETQRAMGVDNKIREIAGRFIEVMKQRHYKDELGNIARTVWECLLFNSVSDYDQYLKSGNTNGAKTFTYEYNGNIFDCYDSFACAKEFLPEDKPGAHFDYLEFLKPDELSALNASGDERTMFYSKAEPEGWRRDFATKPTEQ